MNNKKSEIQISVNTALQASITPIGIDFEMNRLRLGENYCCIFAITDYPSECDYGWLSKLTNIPGTIVSINSEPIDNGEAVNEISKKIRMYRGQAASTKDPRERQRCQKAADDQEKIMAKMDQNGEVMGKWNTTIMVLSRDKEDYNSRCDRVKNVASILGCKIRVLSNLQREGYQQISPTYPQIKRIQETSSRYFPVSTFVGGFPFSSGGFNDGKGFYLGKNSSGGLILLDLWKRGSSRTNSNITIVGGSGSGKSTAIKHIIASEYARGTKIIVIDPESEYKDMCYNPLFEGNWIDVAGGKGGLINPLQIRPVPPDTDDENAEPQENDSIGDLAIHLKTLQTFFRLYIPSMDDRLRALLDQALVELYHKFGISWDTDVPGYSANQFPTLTDLYNLIAEKAKLKDNNTVYYEDLKTYLEGAANGADHRLWNGYTTINPTSGFIVLDTKSLIQMSGTVLAAQYFNVLSWCWEQITHNRKERIMLVADECWTMIDPRCPQSLEFLKNAEKRARKYEGSIIVGTQSTNDFLDPEVKFYGQSVLDLPTFKLLFSMDGKSLKETTELFDLNDAQSEYISSGQRGTALMKVGNQAVIVRFELSEERLEMFGRGGGR